MLLKPLKIYGLIGSIILFFFLSACQQKETDLGKEVLIRVNDRVMTVLDFKNAFEITKIAYEDNTQGAAGGFKKGPDQAFEPVDR